MIEVWLRYDRRHHFFLLAHKTLIDRIEIPRGVTVTIVILAAVAELVVVDLIELVRAGLRPVDDLLDFIVLLHQLLLQQLLLLGQLVAIAVRRVLGVPIARWSRLRYVVLVGLVCQAELREWALLHVCHLAPLQADLLLAVQL